MKNYSRELKSEKGSVTSVVLVTILFFITILSTAYIITSTQRKSQLKSQVEVKDFYQKQIDDAGDIYNSLLEKTPVKPGEIVIGKNREYTDQEGNKAIIPVGFMISEIEEEQTINTGLVIKDEENNEFVWIPVEDVNDMCDISNETEYTVYEDSVEGKVTTKLCSKSGIISEVERVKPGTGSGNCEPSLMPYDDILSENYSKIKKIDGESISSAKELAQLFVDEYNEMIKSVKKYKGFYIGRYELSELGVKKNQDTLTNKDWYDLYSKCSSIKVNNNVKTQMIWGCQWDTTMNWLVNSGAKTSDEVFIDSTSWGNYPESIGDAAVVQNGVNQYGIKQKTGYSEYWKVNNIYDLAGNCFEWSQDKSEDDTDRIPRGGGYPIDLNYNWVSSAIGINNPSAAEDYIRYSSNNDNLIIN